MIKWQGIIWSVHPLFVLIMLSAALTGYFVELLTLFVIVLIHEIGHIVTARGFGWTVREVKLLPFGGVAEVEEAGGVPAKEEALVAIAGPLQNVWMGLIAWTCGELGLWSMEWSEYVVKANIMIGFFNLLPIHPLDGGKLMQAALSYWFNYYKVLVWSSRASIVFSILLLLSAFVPLILEQSGLQLNLLIIGIFLFMSNWTFSRNIPFVFYRFLIHRSRVSERAMARGEKASPLIVNSTQSVLSVARLFKRESYHLIYLLSPDKMEMKVLPEQLVVSSCLSEKNPNRAVCELIM